MSEAMNDWAPLLRTDLKFLLNGGATATQMEQAREIARLEDENAALRVEIRRLKEDLAPRYEMPACLNMTRSQATFMGCLLRLSPRTASYETLICATGSRSAGPQTIAVFAHQVKKMLRPHGIFLRLWSGVGYSIDAENAEKFRALGGGQ